MNATHANTRHRPRTRRELSAQETREKIALSALDLIRQHGWRAATVQRITEHAGVAKGSFFVHFSTKEAVVEPLVAMQIDAAKDANKNVSRSSPLEHLRNTVRMLGRHAGASVELSRAVVFAMSQNPDLARSVETMFEGVYERMLDDASEAVAKGLLTQGAAEPLVGVLLTTYMGTLLRFVTSAHPGTFEDLLLPLVDATLAAFAPVPKAAHTKKARKR